MLETAMRKFQESKRTQSLAAMVLAGTVLFTGSSLMTTATPADAATRVAGKAMPATYMGIEKASGQKFICLDNGRAAPTRFGTAVKIKDGQMAYLLHKYGNTTSNQRAYALSYIAKTDNKLPHSHKTKTPAQSGFSSTTPKMISDMKKEAADFAGKYTVAPKLAINANDKAGTVSNVGIKASSGKFLSGKKITLTISGNANFATNKSKTLTVNSASSAKSYAINRTGSGAQKDNIKVTAKTENIATDTVTYRKPQSSGYQSALMANQETAAVSGSASAAFDALFDYTITTKALKFEDGPGNTRLARDEITLKVTRGTFPKGETVKVNSTLWNNGTKKPARQNSVPANAVKVGTATTSFTAPGTKTTTNVTVPANTGTDYFTWTDTVSATGSIPAHTSQYGVVSETFSDVVNEEAFAPQVRTQTSTPDGDGNVYDTYSVTAGNDEDDTWGRYTRDADGSLQPIPVKVTLELYTSNINPETQKGDSIPKGAKKICTLKTKAYTAPAADEKSDACNVGKDFKGYTTWVESINPEDTPADQGRDLVDAYDGDYGVASETNLVKWTPSVTTQVQTKQVNVGDTLSDQLTVTGMPEKTSDLTATCTVWGPMKTKPEDGGALPQGVEKFDEGTVQVTGDGTYTCDTDRKVEQSGYYTFTEKLSGNDEIVPHEDNKTYTEETAINKWTPTITTKVQDKVVNPGDDLTDILTVSGLENEGGPTGTATCTVWGPSDTPLEDGSEIGDDMKPFASGQVKIDGNGDYKCTVDKKAEKSGYYTFTESFTPDNADEATPFESKVVKTEETLLTRYAPTVTTEASEQTVELKDGKAQISDNLNLSNGKPGETYSVASCVNGPSDVQLKEGTETPKKMQGKCQVVKITADKNGKGTAKSPDFTVTEGGYYWFTYKGGATSTSKEFTDTTVHKSETTQVTVPTIPEAPKPGGPVKKTPAPQKTEGHKASTGGENNEGINPLVIGGGALVLLTLAGSGAYVIRRRNN